MKNITGKAVIILLMFLFSAACTTDYSDDTPTGTEANSYKAPVANPFEIPEMSETVCPAFFDIDDDGDYDLFLSSRPDGIQYFKNIGGADNPIYSLQLDNLGLPETGLNDSPNFITFLDCDLDSNIDMLICPWIEENAEIVHYEWNGTSFEEAAGSISGFPVQQSSSGRGQIAGACDIDGDGDEDVIIVECFYDAIDGYYCSISHKQNKGDGTFSDVSDTKGLEDYSGQYGFPRFLDLDGDKDLDALIGTHDGDYQYFQNSGNTSDAAFDPPISLPFELTAVTGPVPFDIVDIDDDGDPDIFTGQSDGSLLFFENTAYNTDFSTD